MSALAYPLPYRTAEKGETATASTAGVEKAALFLVFGLGYYIASRDMYRNEAIVLLGAIGKFAFSAVFVSNFFAYPGRVPPFFWIPVIGDLAFAVLFLVFLNFARRKVMR